MKYNNCKVIRGSVKSMYHIFHLTVHARQRMEERNFSDKDVAYICSSGQLLQLDDHRIKIRIPVSPFLVLDPNSMANKLAGCVVIADAGAREVITVYRENRGEI